MSRLALLDWRRQVFELYRDVRMEPDPRAAHKLWCDRRVVLHREHPESAAREHALVHAPYDPSLRFVATIDAAEPRLIEIATATDGLIRYERIGRVVLPIGTLDVWWADVYGGGVWLPVRDASPKTYGGGRYILDTIKGADLGGTFDAVTGDGTLVVDVNFAYNPSCAYDDRWACPLPPAGNVVDAALDVGELSPHRNPSAPT